MLASPEPLCRIIDLKLTGSGPNRFAHKSAMFLREWRVVSVH
jgi:hypothetical protein